MDRPEQNDLFYQLMQDGKLQFEDPGMEEDILRKLQPAPHKRTASRNIRRSILFLSLAIILGLVLSGLYAVQGSLVEFPDRSASLFLIAMLIVTFLFLLEKLIRLVKGPGQNPEFT